MPKVSVIVPTYNSAEYIKETIESVLAQEFLDFEIIVIDDASTDNTIEVIESLNCSKIKHIKLDRNSGGPSKPRNVGIAASNGKYIAMCDSDDIMLPGRLEAAVLVLENNQRLGLVFSDAMRFDDVTGDAIGNYLYGYNIFEGLQKKQIAMSSYEISQGDAYNTLFYENYINTSSVTIPASVFNDIGFFDENLSNSEDRDMWFRITREYPIGFISLRCMRYRTRQGSISRRGSDLAHNKIKVIRKQLDFDITSETRYQAHKLIAANLYSIGYFYRSVGDFKNARKYYLLSLKEQPSLVAVKSLFGTFLGYRLLNFICKAFP